MNSRRSFFQWLPLGFMGTLLPMHRAKAGMSLTDREVADLFAKRFNVFDASDPNDRVLFFKPVARPVGDREFMIVHWVRRLS